MYITHCISFIQQLQLFYHIWTWLESTYYKWKLLLQEVQTYLQHCDAKLLILFFFIFLKHINCMKIAKHQLSWFFFSEYWRGWQCSVGSTQSGWCIYCANWWNDCFMLCGCNGIHVGKQKNVSSRGKPNYNHWQKSFDRGLFTLQ